MNPRPSRRASAIACALFIVPVAVAVGVHTFGITGIVGIVADVAALTSILGVGALGIVDAQVMPFPSLGLLLFTLWIDQYLLQSGMRDGIARLWRISRCLLRATSRRDERGLPGRAPTEGTAWRAMRAVGHLMPPAASARWLAEAESFLAEAPQAILRDAVRSYLATAPQVVLASWADEVTRWAQLAIRREVR